MSHEKDKLIRPLEFERFAFRKEYRDTVQGLEEDGFTEIVRGFPNFCNRFCGESREKCNRECQQERLKELKQHSVAIIFRSATGRLPVKTFIDKITSEGILHYKNETGRNRRTTVEVNHIYELRVRPRSSE